MTENMREKYMEIGRMNVEEGMSVRELSQRLDMSKSTVSKAREVYRAYRSGEQAGREEGKEELQGEIDRLEKKLKRLSAGPPEDGGKNSSEIDPQNYLRDAQCRSEGEEGGSGWLWIAAGFGALLVAGGTVYKKLWE